MAEAGTYYRIRNHRPEDLPRLHQVDRICFPPDIAFSRAELLLYLRGPNSISRVAEWGNDIVGFAVGKIERDRSAHVLTLDVVPECRRRGIGTALMESLHNAFEMQGVRMTYLEVDAADMGAQHFYERLSYARVETLKDYYKGRSDAYLMLRVKKSGYANV